MVATGVAALAWCGVAQAQAPPCTAGAPGIGDAYYPTYGNGGYDVGRYDLDVGYDPATDRLDGEATIHARATQALCSFNLDFVGLEVRGVTVGGRTATWRREGGELVVTPARALRNGRPFTARIRYDGVPTEVVIPGFDLRSGFMTTPDGVTVSGQPEVAATWFPVNDHPLDKASYRFRVTVPDEYEVVANGHLRGTRSHRGQTTWDWLAREPMASYLATIDVGFWDIRRWRTSDGVPVLDAVDSALDGRLRAEIDSSLAKQGEILDLLGDAFGAYPFSTVGAIVEGQDDLEFALETQTRPVYSKLFWLDGDGNPQNGDGVVVHELAHQWFGDDLALGRWQDIWLNEGFATYAEWLWSEHAAGVPPAATARAFYNALAADNPFWSVVIGDPGVDDLFSAATYYRGAMAIQALREAVGDDAFWRIVRTWVAEHRGGNVTTPELVALAERISGQDLDPLFDAWVRSAGKPAFAAPVAEAAPRANALAARALAAHGVDGRRR